MKTNRLSSSHHATLQPPSPGPLAPAAKPSAPATADKAFERVQHGVARAMGEAIASGELVVDPRMLAGLSALRAQANAQPVAAPGTAGGVEFPVAERPMAPPPELAKLVHDFCKLCGVTQPRFHAPATHAAFAPPLQRALQATKTPAGQRTLQRAANAFAGSPQASERILLLVTMAQQAIMQALSAINRGEDPDYGPLATALSGLMAGIKSGANAKGAAATKAAAPAPETPTVEAKEQAELGTKIQAALDKNDLGAMRDLAKNPKALAVASPDQKAAMVSALSSDTVSSGDKRQPRGFGALPDEGNKPAINALLNSATSDEEYQSILAQAGPSAVQQAMTTGVQDPKKDPQVTQFDTTAAARGCPELAAVPEHAQMATEALEKGYTPEQIIAARQKAMDAAGNDDKVTAIADDPLVMMLTNPSEKSAMINRLKDGWTTDAEDRAMVSILSSCKDKAEFDEVVAGGGGKSILEEMDDDEAKAKFNRLAGAYGRMDLADNPAEANKCKDALVDPAKEQRLLGGADASVVQPRDVLRTGNVADDFIHGQDEQVRAQVATLDRRTQVETVLENSAREADGKPLFNPRELREEANTILRDPSLKDGDKDKKLEELRQKNGLSEYTMRNVATQPMARIYEDATMQSASFMQAEGGHLQDRLRQALATYGAGSPEAARAQQDLEEFQRKMGAHTAELQGAAKKLNDLYPPPKSWLESLGGFLLGVLKSFAPLLLNLIPVVGSALYAGYTVVKSVVDIANGNLLGGLAGFANALPGLGDALGGAAGAVTSSIQAGVNIGVGVGKAIASGNPMDILGAAAGAAGGLGLDGVSSLLDVAKQGVNVVGGIATGDVGRIMDGAGGLAGAAGAGDLLNGPLKDAAGYVKQGAGVVNAFAKGDVAGGLGTLDGLTGGSLGGVVPAFHQVQDLARQGAAAADAIRNGDLGRAFTTLGGLPGLDKNSDAAKLIQDGGDLAKALARGDLGTTFGALSAVLDGVPGLENVGGVAQQGARVLGALQSGDLATKLQALDGLVTGLGAGPGAAALRTQLAGFHDALAEAQRVGLVGPKGSLHVSDPLRTAGVLAQGLEGFLGAVGGGAFAAALRDLGPAAAALAREPAFQSVLGTVRDGTSFVRALQQGEFTRALQTAGLAGAEPWRAVGQAEAVFGALARHAFSPQVAAGGTRTVLQQVESLVGTLGRGQAQKLLETYAAGLTQLATTAGDPHAFSSMEAHAQELLVQLKTSDTFVRQLAKVLGRKSKRVRWSDDEQEGQQRSLLGLVMASRRA